MDEQWQLYNENAKPIQGKGATKSVVFIEGLLHGASHVWIWRKKDDSVEILLQKRVASKSTWPNCYDISAAGHIDLGEDPVTAAIRETKEEIGLDILAKDLKQINVYRSNKVATSGAIENEYSWLYLLELRNETTFSLQKSEVDSLVWLSLDTFEQETAIESATYVPHGSEYYGIVINSIKSLLN